MAELGIEADLVSTRCPPKGIISQSWAKEAQKHTDYLVPFTFKDFVRASIEMLRVGPVAWFRSTAVVVQAKDLSLSQRFRLLALLLTAGKLAGLATEKGGLTFTFRPVPMRQTSPCLPPFFPASLTVCLSWDQL